MCTEKERGQKSNSKEEGRGKRGQREGDQEEEDVQQHPVSDSKSLKLFHLNLGFQTLFSLVVCGNISLSVRDFLL